MGYHFFETTSRLQFNRYSRTPIYRVDETPPVWENIGKTTVFDPDLPGKTLSPSIPVNRVVYPFLSNTHPLTQSPSVTMLLAEVPQEQLKTTLKRKFIGVPVTRGVRLYYVPGPLYALWCILLRQGSEYQNTHLKQPIRTRYLGHVTGHQPIMDQCFLVRISITVP
eukprot:sb/3472496/